MWKHFFGNTHLDLRHYDASVRTGRGEGGERSGQHYGTRPSETAEVAARDVVHFMPHDHRIHDEESWPWQPQRVFLHDERGALEAQRYGHASTGEQVKTEREPEDDCALVNRSLRHTPRGWIAPITPDEQKDNVHSLCHSYHFFLSLWHAGICNGSVVDSDMLLFTTQCTLFSTTPGQ